jgi:hypothetical protein
VEGKGLRKGKGRKEEKREEGKGEEFGPPQCSRQIDAYAKKQKLFIRRQKLPYSYNMWLGNGSLNFLINLKLWCMRVF